MSVVVIDWVSDRIPNYDDEGETVLRWVNRNGHVQETTLEYVVDRFGTTIESSLAADKDVVEAIQTGDFDDAWKDIWALWREYGWA